MRQASHTNFLIVHNFWSSLQVPSRTFCTADTHITSQSCTNPHTRAKNAAHTFPRKDARQLPPLGNMHRTIHRHYAFVERLYTMRKPQRLKEAGYGCSLMA